jgi:colicin import membrane protein
MVNRSLSLVFRLIILLALSFPAQADDVGPSPERLADWQQRLDAAAALQAESQARQAAADQVLAEKEAACFKKFLVTGCQREARQAHLSATQEASRLAREGKALERAVKKEQLIDKDRRAVEAVPKRQADRQERAAEVAAERELSAQREAAARADKAQKAVEGEKYRQRQAAHDARVAAKVKEAERRVAEAAARPK